MSKFWLGCIIICLLASLGASEVPIDKGIRLGDDGDFFKITYTKTFNVDKVPETPLLVFDGVSGVERMSDWSWYSFDDVTVNGKKITTMNYIAGTSSKIQLDKGLIKKGSNTITIQSGKTNYLPEDDAHDDFTISAIRLVEGADTSLKLSYANKKLTALLKDKKTGKGIPLKVVTFHEESQAVNAPAPLIYLGEATTGADGKAELAYDPADKTKPKTIRAHEEDGAQDTLVIDFGDGLKGKITDGHGKPMPYLKVTVKFDGHDFPGRTDKNGEYSIKIDDFKPDAANPKDVTLKIEFTYELGGKNYYTVIDELVGSKLVTFEKKFKLRVQADKTQDVDFNFNFPDCRTVDHDLSSTSCLDNLKHWAPVYTHMNEAIDFALNKLKANIDWNLPVDVKVGDNGGTRYNGQTSTIFIDNKDAAYGDTDRPKNREYHEFGHHIMYANYGAWPANWNDGKTVNHNGYINPKTDDSFLEGFAEFMALLTAEYNKDPHPEIYASFGSLETNRKVWSAQGKDEEFAIAGLLWDIYDSHSDRGDRYQVSLDKMWDILKVNRNDLLGYYKAFHAADPASEAPINNIFIAHGVFADKNRGNGRYDPEEPFLDTNGDKAYNAGEPFVDYGRIRGANPYMGWDRGEEIGRATTYNRTNRTMAGRIPNAYVKVSDTQEHYYTVHVAFKDPEDGEDYDYTTDVRDGKIYLHPLPEDVEATITVKPGSGEYSASSEYVTNTQDILDKLYSIPSGQGYFDTHTFDLKPTGAKPTQTYETVNNAKPTYEPQGNEFDNNQPGTITEHTGQEGGGDSGPTCCCMPALPLILALFGTLIMKRPLT